MLTYTTRPLGTYGSEILGLDLRATPDEATFRSLADLLFERHVLIIRGQQLDHAQYSRFGHLWGRPLKLFVPSQRDREYPELIWIVNNPATPARARDAAMFWHADSSYETVPATVTMLYGVRVPETGGETLFSNLAAAYEALPEHVKVKIDALQGMHLLGYGQRTGKEIDGRNLHTPESDALRARERPVHPLVITHPIAKRKSLYAIAGHNIGILDMPQADADALLVWLKEHATAERFRLAAKVGVGDVMIWDNLSVLHCATPTRYSGLEQDRRELLRISTTGLPAVYGNVAHIFAERVDN